MGETDEDWINALTKSDIETFAVSWKLKNSLSGAHVTKGQSPQFVYSLWALQ